MTSTIDAHINSYIKVAADCDFPIQNLPLGVFKPNQNAHPRVGVALGEHIIDLANLSAAKLIDLDPQLFNQPTLNALFACGIDTCRTLRRQLLALLRDDPSVTSQTRDKVQHALYPLNNSIMCVPVNIGDYTDFYSSEQHAFNVGSMFRGKGNELMPNWKHMPIGYHGRSSSIVTTGALIERPFGQTWDATREQAVFGPCKRLDFELEVGFFTAKTSQLGTPIAIEDAEGYIIGLVLVNDWSARDIQKWEYQPLGPFLAKSFATSISPWVVMLDALEPFRITSPKQDPTPLPYLQPQSLAHHFDIKLEVDLQTLKMTTPETICRSNFKYLYWSMAQQLAHHTITGCNINVGDMMASGTISGPTRGAFGSLLEISWGGQNPLMLSSGEQRSFIEDGDTITMRGFAQHDQYRIGFGKLSNQVVSNRHFHNQDANKETRSDRII